MEFSRYGLSVLTALVGLVLGATTALGVAGDLDPTFSGDGRVKSGFYVLSDAIAIQPDGKIVVAATWYDPSSTFSESRFAVARYNTDGTIDRTFSQDGKLTTRFNNFDSAKGVALQTDGKIVVAGITRPDPATFGAHQIAVARYSPSGTLDRTFDGDGRAVWPTLGTWAEDVQVDASGHIITVGFLQTTIGGGESADQLQLAAEFMPDGSRNARFGNVGLATFDAGGNPQQSASALAIQPDQRIVVSGVGQDPNVDFETSGPDADFSVARLLPDGSLDTSFSGDGMFGSGWRELAFANDLVISPINRKITVVGVQVSHEGSASNFALLRLMPDGTLDTRFGEFGLVDQSIGDREVAEAVVLQGRKTVVAGWGGNEQEDVKWIVARFTAAGALDSTTFGTGGFVKTSIDRGGHSAHDAALQEDGKLIVAGERYLARYVL